MQLVLCARPLQEVSAQMYNLMYSLKPTEIIHIPVYLRMRCGVYDRDRGWSQRQH